MPATLTHAKFAVDVYNSLDKTYKTYKTIDNKDFLKYKMFAQSTDPLMFYNIESLHKGRNIRQLQFYFHTNKSQDFFIKLCQIIKDNKLYNDSSVISFLYGFICHYVLDSNIHPFVIYKTGLFDKKKKDTYKYNGCHAYMETYLDNIMLKNMNEDPYSFKIYNYSFDLDSFSDNLNMVISKSFKDVFSVNNMDNIYYKSLKQMRRFLKRYRYDKFGIKLFFYKMLDLFTSKRMFRFYTLSYHTSLENDDRYLNESRKNWYNPVDPSIKSNKSFYDLYNKSITEACYIIKEVNRYFNSDVDLKKVFSNKSYLSGLSCDVPHDFKKFEF